MQGLDHIFPPPVVFYFNVTFEGLIEVPFQEVSGIRMEMETETVKEGGENGFSLSAICADTKLQQIKQWL